MRGHLVLWCPSHPCDRCSVTLHATPHCPNSAWSTKSFTKRCASRMVRRRLQAHAVPHPLTGNEQHLLAACRQLNAEIVSNVAKVQTALQLSEEDQATILALKRELEKSWKSLDASIEKVCTRAGQSAAFIYHCHPGGWSQGANCTAQERSCEPQPARRRGRPPSRGHRSARHCHSPA